MQAWIHFLEVLAQKLGNEAVKTWLRPLKIVHFDACNLYLEASSTFQIEWFEEHIRPKLLQTFCNSNGKPIKIHITSSEATSPNKHFEEKKAAQISSSSPQLRYIHTEDHPLEEYTLDQFIFSQENQILSSLIEKIEQNSAAFNPLVFYGPSSCGKTHLLQAFYHMYTRAKKKVLYVRVDTFTDNFVQAIRSGHMQQFREVYRQVDVLIVDDIQYLAKKWATQEEFFHTFNALYSVGKQILLSASLPPASLKEIEPRLISRFEWGLSLPIAKLSGKDLLLLLDKQIKQFQLVLTEEAETFLIKQFSSDVGSLQKAITAICLRTNTKHSTPIQAAEVQEILSDLIKEQTKYVLTPEGIVSHIATFYGIPSKELLGKAQAQEYSFPRQIAMFLCREKLKMPYAKIGDFFTRDHSTVMSSVKIIEEKIEKKDRKLLAAIETLPH